MIFLFVRNKHFSKGSETIECFEWCLKHPLQWWWWWWKPVIFLIDQCNKKLIWGYAYGLIVTKLFCDCVSMNIITSLSFIRGSNQMEKLWSLAIVYPFLFRKTHGSANGINYHVYQSRLWFSTTTKGTDGCWQLDGFHTITEAGSIPRGT